MIVPHTQRNLLWLGHMPFNLDAMKMFPILFQAIVLCPFVGAWMPASELVGHLEACGLSNVTEEDVSKLFGTEMRGTYDANYGLHGVHRRKYKANGESSQSWYYYISGPTVEARPTSTPADHHGRGAERPMFNVSSRWAYENHYPWIHAHFEEQGKTAEVDAQLRDLGLTFGRSIEYVIRSSGWTRWSVICDIAATAAIVELAACATTGAAAAPVAAVIGGSIAAVGMGAGAAASTAISAPTPTSLSTPHKSITASTRVGNTTKH